MKLRLTYQPEGVPDEGREEWTVDLDRLLTPEIVTIERMTRLTYAQWGDALRDGSHQAVHALLFVLKKRSNPQLRPDALSFGLADYTLDPILDDDQARQLLEQLRDRAADPDVEPDPAEADLLAELEERFAPPPEAEPAPDELEPVGKAPVDEAAETPAAATA